MLPVIVSGYVPVAALRLTVIFSVEFAVAVTGFGVKLALVRGGKPLTLRLTELEPFTAVTVTVVEPFAPRCTVSELDGGERAKSGALVDPPAVKEAIAVLQLKLKNGLFLV